MVLQNKEEENKMEAIDQKSKKALLKRIEDKKTKEDELRQSNEEQTKRYGKRNATWKTEDFLLCILS